MKVLAKFELKMAKIDLEEKATLNKVAIDYCEKITKSFEKRKALAEEAIDYFKHHTEDFNVTQKEGEIFLKCLHELFGKEFLIPETKTKKKSVFTV